MEIIKEYPIEFVCLLGVAIVFVGLICIVLLCKILSALCNLGTKSEAKVEAPVSAPTVAQPTQNIPNRKKIVAAVSAAIAEELGTDVSAIRIVSLKKI